MTSQPTRLIRSQSLHGGLRAAGTHACGMGLFRFVRASRQVFRSTLPDQADHASTHYRRREVVGRTAGATNQAGCDRRDRGRAEGHRTLVLEGRPKDTTEALQKFLTAVA